MQRWLLSSTCVLVAFATALSFGPVAWAGGKYKVLHAFKGGLDGGGIYDPVAFDSEGNLYGTTWAAGQMGTARSLN
jgi:hypothetical protein